MCALVLHHNPPNHLNSSLKLSERLLQHETCLLHHHRARSFDCYTASQSSFQFPVPSMEDEHHHSEEPVKKPEEDNPKDLYEISPQDRKETEQHFKNLVDEAEEKVATTGCCHCSDWLIRTGHGCNPKLKLSIVSTFSDRLLDVNLLVGRPNETSPQAGFHNVQASQILTSKQRKDDSPSAQNGQISNQNAVNMTRVQVAYTSFTKFVENGVESDLAIGTGRIGVKSDLAIGTGRETFHNMKLVHYTFTVLVLLIAIFHVNPVFGTPVPTLEDGHHSEESVNQPDTDLYQPLADEDLYEVSPSEKEEAEKHFDNLADEAEEKPDHLTNHYDTDSLIGTGHGHNQPSTCAQTSSVTMKLVYYTFTVLVLAIALLQVNLVLGSPVPTESYASDTESRKEPPPKEEEKEASRRSPLARDEDLYDCYPQNPDSRYATEDLLLKQEARAGKVTTGSSYYKYESLLH
ncbi:hypothetical protein KEM48_006594 [Puccinia striiformis f. sp. tritici PST-130]|nr:hypothetical protein KEM48_006594 [Puccinia striiformis f. sp. tritici PST-130]